ncbi:hypothetical protein H311_00331 [Anncaliia algerae PRA109]|nr:hypothetical protein H311_00331 [Anncaliia algerae PRA109]
MDDKDVRMEIFLIEGEDFFENKSLRGKMDEIIKNSSYELKEIYYSLGIEDKFPNDLGLDFFGFPRSERLYNLIRVEFRKDILYLESFYLSFFNHLNHISYNLLSLRSSLSFMSSLDSTNRLACRSNYDKKITKFSFSNNKSDNFPRDFLNEYTREKIFMS